MQTRAPGMVCVRNIVTRVLVGLPLVFTIFEDQTVVTGRRGGGRSSRSHRNSRSGSRSGGFGSGGSGSGYYESSNFGEWTWILLAFIGAAALLVLIKCCFYDSCQRRSENESYPLCKPAEIAESEKPGENKPVIVGGYHPGQATPYQ